MSLKIAMLYKKLYWCNTFDYMRQGFIIADNIRQARKDYGSRFFCYAKDVVAKRICRLPTMLQGTEELFPTDMLLQTCGCQLVNMSYPNNTRLTAVVKLMLKPGGRIWCCPKTNLIVQESL